MIALDQARQHLETLGLKQAVEILENTLDAAASRQLPYPEMLAELLGAEVAARRERYSRRAPAWLTCPSSAPWSSLTSVSNPPWTSVRSRNWPAWHSWLRPPTSCCWDPRRGQDPPGSGPGAQGHGERTGGLLRPGLRADGGSAQGQGGAQPGPQDEVYLAPKVLVVDEFGIWPYDRESATAFFTLVSARYERGSIILTSTRASESGAN